jgi:hypothetical protein
LHGLTGKVNYLPLNTQKAVAGETGNGFEHVVLLTNGLQLIIV